MRQLAKFLFFLLGTLMAIFIVGALRQLPGAFGQISVLTIAITLFFFLKSNEAVFAFAAGLAVGLGLFSGYGFWAWLAIVAIVCAAGYVLSRNLFTDQSLFALVAINAILHVVLFVSEYVVSNLVNLNYGIKLIFGLELIRSGLLALVMETAILYAFFLLYRKKRAKHGGRLSHIR